MINYEFFPKNAPIPNSLKEVVDVFFSNSHKSPDMGLSSNEVLNRLETGLINIGYMVEKIEDGKLVKISIPVLFGKNGKKDKEFQVDAYHELYKIVIEVEAGQGVTNYKFLKDFFEASIMIDVDYLIIAVCNLYKPKSSKNGNKDFETVSTFFDTLYTSGKLMSSLKGVLIVGY